MKTVTQLSEYFMESRIVDGRLDVVEGSRCNRWKIRISIFLNG